MNEPKGWIVDISLHKMRLRLILHLRIPIYTSLFKLAKKLQNLF